MSKPKEIIRRLLPKPIWQWLQAWRFRVFDELLLIQAFVSDYFKYRRYSYRQDRKQDHNQNLHAMIMMEAHCIEKAFSLPEIRSGYGVERIRTLIGLLERYRAGGCDPDGLSFRKAGSVLAEYIRYHEEIGYDLGKFKEEILPWADLKCDIGGYLRVTRDELLQRAHGDFKSCAQSRCSIRNYVSSPIPEETIREVLSIARKTPSVCNRQAWHTYIIKNPDLKAAVLELQKGSGGFGSLADFLVIITTDTASFVGPGERHEAYVDGGLYAMSVLYALHYKGIAACPLNWTVDLSVDRKLRDVIPIKASQNVIMIMSAGTPPETVRVAKSVRKEIDEAVTIL